MEDNNQPDQFNPQDFLKSVSSRPGIYKMFDVDGDVLYVGKAKNLKKRLSSYFRRQVDSPKTQVLVSKIAHIETIITNNENEALILENNLIKAHRPRYNVIFRDDKSYPYIEIAKDEAFPRLTYYRGKRKKDHEYFGPYSSVMAVKETLSILEKVFKLRTCEDNYFRNRTRPCLQYQIKRCSAPCVNYINEVAYADQINKAKLFLQGKNQQLIKQCLEEMQQASESQDYERAAELRDQIHKLRYVQNQQGVESQKEDIDIIIGHIQEGIACVVLLTVRAGRLLSTKSFFPETVLEQSEKSLIEAFIPQFYLAQQQKQPPKYLIVNIPVESELSNFLSEHFGHSIAIKSRVRGRRLKWLNLGEINFQDAFQNHVLKNQQVRKQWHQLEVLVGRISGVSRIECFDISHTMGQNTIASCVVFDENGPVKSHYRRYNIADITPGDDYAAMKQVIQRRFKKITSSDMTQLPDILLIDGGKGQLQQTYEALSERGIEGVLLLGISKGPGRKPEYDKVTLFGESASMDMVNNFHTLHLLQRIRDEAHRFAITGHRKGLSKQSKKSKLEDIPGIGSKRRRELLLYFGGLQGVEQASIQELTKVPGISQHLAKVIYDNLH